MKNLEWQVSNLELSKRLRELGVKQESLIYWESYYLPITTSRHNNLVFSKDIGVKKPVKRSGFPVSKLKRYSAFTVAELFNMLQEKDLCDTIIARWVNADYLANKLIRHYEKSTKKN